MVRDYAPQNYQLAYEIVECQQVVKGYGETHANGLRNFNAIMKLFAEGAGLPTATHIAMLRGAALQDETGSALQRALSHPGADDTQVS